MIIKPHDRLKSNIKIVSCLEIGTLASVILVPAMYYDLRIKFIPIRSE